MPAFTTVTLKQQGPSDDKEIATVLATLAAAAELIDALIGVFSRGDDVPEWLRRLPGAVGALFEKIQEVIEILNGLKLQVEIIVTEKLIELLRAELASHVRQYVDAMELLRQGPESAPIALARLDEIRPGLMTTARTLVEGYPYAAVHAVAVAMTAEADILKQLNRPTAERKQSLGYYASYFRKVVDPSVIRSYGSALNEAKRELEETLPTLKGNSWVAGKRLAPPRQPL
jgi:hypothetical protein